MSLEIASVENVSVEIENGAEEVLEVEAVEETDAEAVSAEATSLEPVSLRESISALLFLAPRPLNSLQLAEYCDVSPESIDDILPILQNEIASLEVGFELVEVGGAWQFRTRASCAKIVTKLIPIRARKLSKAAAETLAVVAYKQPVPRSEIEAIRGVDALPTLKTLLDARLIRVIGRDDSVGQPALYGTTQTFLEKYGLRDLAELPTVREIVELTTEPGEITAEASAEDSAEASAESGLQMAIEQETIPQEIIEQDFVESPDVEASPEDIQNV